MIRPTRIRRGHAVRHHCALVCSALEGFIIDENDLEVRSRMRDPRSIHVVMYETNKSRNREHAKNMQCTGIRVVVVAHCCSLEEF
jgi:hypothetical protein